MDAEFSAAELTRISGLNIECPRFDAVIKNMIDSQRTGQ